MRRSLLAFVLGSFLVALTSGTALADPPGNNGTVKIQDLDHKEVPDNDPHVACVFLIEFRGYDEGDLEATWALRAHPPSGTGTLVQSGSVGIGEDAAGGAPDLDATVVVTVTEEDLAGLTEHPQQGFHLKLTVHAEGSIGSDTKHKVFWVQDCPSGSELGAPAGNLTVGSAANVTEPATPSRALPFLVGGLALVIVLALAQPIRGLVRRRTDHS